MSQAHQRAKVLVADDNQALREGILAFLAKKRPKWEVKMAHNGEEAIRILASFVPDVALLDVYMPIFTGTEVAAHIAATGLSSKVVLLTAEDCLTLKHSGSTPAGTIFIDKANLVRDLLPAVDRLLDTNYVAVPSRSANPSNVAK